MRYKLWLIGVFLALSGIVMCGCVRQSETEIGYHELQGKNWAIQLQNADPDVIAKSGIELVVIDYSRDGSEQGEYSLEEIRKMKDSGVIPIAYLSIGEAEDYRFYRKKEWLGKENPEWEGNYAVKYWDEEWKAILHTYLDKIIEQGFSGVYRLYVKLC